MADKVPAIQIIDCGAVGLNVNERNITSQDIICFGEKIKNALSTSGFCYLSNHGIEKQLIEGYMNASRIFFAQPVEVKQKYVRTKERDFGWDAVERERLNADRPGDLKEAFNYVPGDDNGEWPDVEDFQMYSQLLFDACKSLTKRILNGLSVGLGLDISCMADAHTRLGKKDNSTALRTLYYPAISKDSAIKPGQIRLGEHSDFGTITLLFQDDIGGLEANIPGKGFVPVTPVPDTIVVNIGDLMQRWTSDALIATKHRVLIPESEMKKRKSRQSVVFFVHPDHTYVIKPLDGSDKYKPVTGLVYLREKLNATF